jgi:hypothetical protein
MAVLRRSADSPWLEQPLGVPGVRRGQASLPREPRTPTRTSLGPTPRQACTPASAEPARPPRHQAPDPPPGYDPRARPSSASTHTQRSPAQNPDSTFLRIDPMNPENHKNPVSAFSRIDPLNPEPSAFPNPGPRPVQRFHQSAHIREFMRCAAVAEAAPQARSFCRG